jgi:hypothetical protein
VINCSRIALRDPREIPGSDDAISGDERSRRLRALIDRRAAVSIEDAHGLA